MNVEVFLMDLFIRAQLATGCRVLMYTTSTVHMASEKGI